MSEPVVALEGVSAGYGNETVLENVNLAVGPGQLVALVGANGAGKSTLLKVIAGLLAPSAGTVSVLGRAAGRASELIAYLPQAEQLRWDFPLLVEQVVVMGRIATLGIGRRYSAEDRVAAKAALFRVDAMHLMRRPVSALSGGERQRVLLARALVADPRLLLLDEPATGVDPTTEELLMGVLRELADEGRTVLVSTHDLAGVMAHFQRVVALNGGIVADGDVEILRDAAILRRTYGGHRSDDEPHLMGMGDGHHA